MIIAYSVQRPYTASYTGLWSHVLLRPMVATAHAQHLIEEKVVGFQRWDADAMTCLLMGLSGSEPKKELWEDRLKLSEGPWMASERTELPAVQYRDLLVARLLASPLLDMSSAELSYHARSKVLLAVL